MAWYAFPRPAIASTVMSSCDSYMLLVWPEPRFSGKDSCGQRCTARVRLDDDGPHATVTANFAVVREEGGTPCAVRVPALLSVTVSAADERRCTDVVFPKPESRSPDRHPL